MSLLPETFDQITNAIQTVQQRDDEPGDVHVHIAKKRKHIDPLNPFALCFVGSLAVIIQKRKLSPTALALLFLLLELARFGNLVSVNQAGLAVRLGVQQPAISKALAKLEAAGLILNLPDGQFFNPQIITKQGLDAVARNYPAAVSAGIKALAQQGMPANWELPPRPSVTL